MNPCSLMDRVRALGLGAFVVWACMADIAAWAASSRTIHFNRDIRPLLADQCFACHGPDKAKRKAGLRLDRREEALITLESGHVAIRPGKPDQSRLLEVVTAADDEDRMPPAKTGKKLSSEQVQLLRDWIEQGAPWMEHWAYLAPEKPALPKNKKTGWAKGPVDEFILARLEQEGLTPSPEADSRTWLRRVTLDLTGLPPTVAETKQFLSDTAPDARGKVVDRLLASPAFGERMAQHWLDLARYADSDGYHADTSRSMWQYRDYVIHSFNANKPFDQFTVEQLAGDLLPNPTLDQRVATAFNRNGMSSTEGGADPDEYMNKYVTDRVNTFGTVFLGSSVACTECHDHKYDPFTQKEYYQLYDFFNRIPERGLDNDPAPPFIKVPTAENVTRLMEMTNRVNGWVADRNRWQNQTNAETDRSQEAWEKAWRERVSQGWNNPRLAQSRGGAGTTLEAGQNGVFKAVGTNTARETYEMEWETPATALTALRIEALGSGTSPETAAGRSTNGMFKLTGLELDASPLKRDAETEQLRKVQWRVWSVLGPFTAANPKEALEKTFIPESVAAPDLNATYEQGKIRWLEQAAWMDGTPQKMSGENQVSYLSRTIESPGAMAIRLAVGCDGGFKLWLNGKPVDGGRVYKGVAQDPALVVVHLKAGTNQLLMKAHHGSGTYGFYFAPAEDALEEYTVRWAGAVDDAHAKDAGAALALDGKTSTGWSLDAATPDAAGQAQALFFPEEPIRFASGVRLRLRLKFEGERPGESLARFRVALTEQTGLDELSKLPQDIVTALLRSPHQIPAALQLRVREYYRDQFVPELVDVNAKLAESRKTLEDYERRIPTLRVMDDKEPRVTQIRVRGDYRHRGDTVQAGVPHHLPPLEKGGSTNRLDLARWLTSPQHPLLSRVTVNRYWALLFGTGLVKTGNEFGSQGELPSHPELLDWLAVHYREMGWNTKAFLKELVLSATYGQSSRPTPELLAKDPANRLWARGPRPRLSAEMIRDCALDYAGLLDRNRPVGGPSVKPYQPAGLWEEKMFGGNKYEESSGADLYRRSLYTLWKRTVLNPTLMTFDAPDRAICTEQRSVTCTPLQAFVTLNEKGFVEAARGFAQRVMQSGASSWNAQLEWAFETMLSRPPLPREIQVIRGVYDDVLATYQRDLKSAVDLLSVGESPRPKDVNELELVAWTAVGNLMLNLDETVTKE